MRFTVEDEAGDPVSFECPDSLASRWTCGAILEGHTYPHLPFVGEVRTALDVGANCGATTVHLARHHPSATIHAFEPGREARSYLEANVEGLPGVTVHPFGLHDHDHESLLVVDQEDIGKASVVPRADGSGASEQVTLRAAGAWAAESGIGPIDVLKVDVEGCEVQVLRSLGDLLAEVKALYVEYDSRGARRDIDHLLAPTHELYFSMLMALDQGECLYVRKDLADHPDAVPRLRQIFGRRSQSRAG